MQHYSTKLFVLSLLLIIPGWAHAQLQIQHTAPTVIETGEATQLRFRAPGLNDSKIQEAYLYYRTEGGVSYQQSKASYQQGSFNASLKLESEDVSSVEYYFSVRLKGGKQITYPNQRPSEQPVRVEVVGEEKKETKKKDKGPARKIAYNILSPQPGQAVTSEDLVIAVTFFYEDTTLRKGRFQLHLDGQNVTENADARNYFISYVPNQIRQGSHTIEIYYAINGKQYPLAEWKFKISGEAELASELTMGNEQRNFTDGRVQFSARNQQLAQSKEDILRGRVELRGQQGNIRYRASGNLTSQASSRLQPQNRFSAEVLVGDWGELRAGDFYQRMSRLTLSGRRVRGVNAEVHLNGENINGMFVYGRMRRGISNLYQSINASYDTVGTFGNQPIVDSTYTLNFRDQGRGTYERKVIGGRISFGDETPIRWGLNAIKVQDDTTSVEPIDGFFDAKSRSANLTGSLNAEEIQYLNQNPDALSVAGHPEPKGNFVTSTDLTLTLDQNRIRVNAEVGASLLNNDIGGGYLTQERASDLGLDLDQGTENILSSLSWLIIVNENMSTLPFQFEKSGTGDSEMQPFVPMAIFGGHSQARFSYYGHRLSVRYRWMGPDYQSLANSTIRRDLSGFNIRDRFSLMENQIFVTVGYERLQDNVLQNEDATTTTATYRTNLSWFPVRQNLPRVSAGIRVRNRGNGVSRVNPFLSGDKLFAAVRNVRTTANDTVVAPRPVDALTTQLNLSVTQQFEVRDVINDATLNVSYMNTEDNVFKYGGLESMSYSLQVQNRYTNLPLDTQIGFHLNQSESRGGISSFDIFGVSIGGTAFLLDDKLELSGRLAYTKNTQDFTSLEINRNKATNIFDNYYVPSSGKQTRESNTYVVNVNARYQVAARHSILARASFTNVVSADAARSLPNDRILELRYMFEF